MRGDVSSIPCPFYVISWFPTSVIFRGEFARTEDGWPHAMGPARLAGVGLVATVVNMFSTVAMK